jgi:hypothetical protein
MFFIRRKDISWANPSNKNLIVLLLIYLCIRTGRVVDMASSIEFRSSFKVTIYGSGDGSVSSM